MSPREEILEYPCAGHRVYGVLHVPRNPSSAGFLMIGRTGSDRQAVYLARAAVSRGIPSFRFDFRGRGNCEGPVVSVEETNADLVSALEAFQKAVPGIRSFTIWGLSEGAASALLYARHDPRITGLVLVNPWIRSEQAVARQALKQNVSRVADPGFWNRIRRSETGYLGAARTFSKLVANVLKAPRAKDTLKERVIEGLSRFTGDVCIILSGGDPATAVFLEAASTHIERLRQSGRLTMHTLSESDHVFSRGDWRQQLVAWSVDFTAAQSLVK